AADGAGARWDILFAFPEAVIDADQVDFLPALDAAWSAAQIAHHDTDLPFRGGWLLYLGYELAASIEPALHLPASDGPLPTALALRCPAAILVDRRERCCWLISEPNRAELLDRMATDIERVVPEPIALPALADVIEDAPADYLAGVQRIHEYLRAGDVFQVNLSRAWHARYESTVTPAALYGSLRRANPAPFAAMLQWQGSAVLSSSPERLVCVRGDSVQTRPIAGTRARFAGDDDTARREELVGHPKERAEHVMLIDLERNDLGRIAVPGSVVVDEMMTVETYAHVHHIVSNVSARQRDGVTPGEVIRAVFPGGTITGCPKIRCMQIIAELEGVGRGAYTGSIGYLNRDGDMDLNILIRTLTVAGAGVDFRAGAGIVVDSDPERELQETRAKARGLLNALTGENSRDHRAQPTSVAAVGVEE
ncbi:MAG: aminodeoxychorismate synthase component I, partial [Dokdonella sp.]